MKKTKIVCTIGPATADVEVLKKMILAGMNVARLNFSHGGYQDQERFIKAVKQAIKQPVTPISKGAEAAGLKKVVVKVNGSASRNAWTG